MTAPARAFTKVVAHDLIKVYGPTRALVGVSLVLEAGQVTTIEGPNGAGKSTLLALLATLARPTGGTLRFGNLDPKEDLDLVRPEIGLVAHDAMVYTDLTARESLAFYARLYELPDPRTAVDAALARGGLTEFGDRPARTFSRGQLQRLALARATLHDPMLLLFDEPTTGLDTIATERVADAIAGARKEGRIVVVVTHDAAFAARVADRRVHLERGKLVKTDSIAR